MTFNNYRILNKSTFRLANTFFSTWFDPDLGNYIDDIIGCDVARGLGYCYNADSDDEGALGYGLNPPAVGFDFFQGPFADYFDGIVDWNVGKQGFDIKRTHCCSRKSGFYNV